MANPSARFAPLLRRFCDRRVLVLGDMVADEYVVGRPARISREAPVLILHHSETFMRPGGATNTAYNLRALGAETTVVGIVGDDEPGKKLRDTLDSLGVNASCLVIDPDRPTSTKTRILAKGVQEARQQIVRIDSVDERPVASGTRHRLISHVRSLVHLVDALIISDYEHGVISQEIIDAALPAARAQGISIFVDARGLMRFKGITAAKPNQPEAESSLGRTISTEAELDAAGKELLDNMDALGILITRGSEGMALYERGAVPYLLPVATATESAVIDVTGAGDTVSAVFSLAIASGASMREAAYLANIAGGEVVRRLGAVTISPDELLLAADGTPLIPPEPLP